MGRETRTEFLHRHPVSRTFNSTCTILQGGIAVDSVAGLCKSDTVNMLDKVVVDSVWRYLFERSKEIAITILGSLVVGC